MDVSNLRVFEAVARHGSMTKAANELHTVQSNVTARIKALEDELETSLFQRQANGVRMTPAGQRLLPYVGRIDRLLSEAAGAARDDGTPSGILSIGALETTAALRLAPILTGFVHDFPKVYLKFSTGTTNDLVKDVVGYRLDAAFVAGPVEHAELTKISILEEKLMLATSRSVRSIRGLSALHGVDILVFRQGCSYRQRLETLLSQNGIVIRRTIEIGSLETIISCVCAGIGVTLLPTELVESAASRGTLNIHDLPPGQDTVQTVLVHRSETHIGSALAAFLSLLTKARQTTSSVHELRVHQGWTSSPRMMGPSQ